MVSGSKDFPAATSLAKKFDVAAKEPQNSKALRTPPASKGKPSPPTGPKVSKPVRCDPLELQLQAMQKQLEEQGAKIALYESNRARVKKPANPLELQLQAMQKQLEEQSAQLKMYEEAANPAASPKPASKAAQQQQKPRSSPAPSTTPMSKASPAETNDEADGEEPIIMPDGFKVIGHDALRMRLKRMCTKKTSGKAWVDDQTIEEYKAGGASREALELALVETIREVGAKASHAKTRVPRLHACV